MQSHSHRRIKSTKEKFGSNKSLKSFSSDSSDSSVILSMCPLSINENYYPLVDDKKSLITTTNMNQELQSNQYETYEQNKDNQLKIKSNSIQLISTEQELTRRYSFNIGKQISNDDDKLFMENKNKKRSFQLPMKNLLKIQPEFQSSTDSSIISTQSCLHQLILRPEILSETEQIEKLEFLPRSSIDVPIRIELSAERLDRFKQRQIDLDRSVTRLIDNSPMIVNENLSQVSKHWSYIKQILLEKYQPTTNHFQLFDYLIKSTYSNKQLNIDLNENDEIKAALEILSQTLTIIHDKITLSIINQLFDDEEKMMLENLRHQYELLFSSYKDELSFIREQCHFYQLNLNEERKFKWIQLIQIDYPCLIEKISTDFMIKIPQIEQILLQMLRNLNKQLLKNYIFK